VSPFGIFDMAGNVREHCADKYKVDFYRKSPEKDPFNTDQWFGPLPGTIRGGGYAFTEWDSRATSRDDRLIINPVLCTGFRCVAGGLPPPATR